MPRLWSCLAAVLVTPGLLRQAAAQPEDAEALVRQGVELRGNTRDAEALQRFRRAYELRPAPRVLAQIALAEQAVGDWLSAERDLAQVTHDSTDAWVARNRAVLDSALQEVRAHVATLRVECTVTGAEIRIDGTVRGRCPADSEIRVVAGDHTVTVSRDGFERFEQRVAIPAGAELRETVDLSPVAPPPAAPAPAEPPPVAARVEATRSMAAHPAVPRTGTPVLGWTLAAAGIAFVGGGVAASLVASDSASVYNDDSRCFYGTLTRDQRCGSYRDRANTAAAMAILGYALGAASGLGAAAVFLTSRPSGAQRSLIGCAVSIRGILCDVAF